MHHPQRHLPRPARGLRPALGVGLWIAAAAVAGCSTGPARVEPPRIDPARAGRLAIEQYDTNGDGVISGQELERAPGIRAALARFDTDGDGAVSAEKIAARVRRWQQTRTGLMSFGFTVTLDGRPLEGATVTFEPEPFLGEAIKPASCMTNSFGGGGASIAKEDRPDPSYPPGMHMGLYRVKISKVVGGQETVPDRYNERTILGQEVARDVPEIANNNVVYQLTTR